MKLTNDEMKKREIMKNKFKELCKKSGGVEGALKKLKSKDSFGRSRRRSRRGRKNKRSRISRNRSKRIILRLSKKRGPRNGKRYIKPKGMSCKDFLSAKIAENMREFKKGKLLSNGRKITNRKQAIAISYSTVRNSGCKI